MRKLIMIVLLIVGAFVLFSSNNALALEPQIASGPYHTAVIKSDGTIWAWGVGGAIGDGTTIFRQTPVQVGSDTDWVKIAAGDRCTFAIKSDGTLWGWGMNWYNQFGSDNRLSPGQMGTDSDWKDVVAGVQYALALKADGTLWAWGYNYYGQLGDGTTTNRTSIVQVGIDTDWKTITVGNAHTLAIKIGGSLWAWGWNSYGQLGDNTSTNRYSPVQVGTETNWKNVDAGNWHTVASKTDNSIWGWGANWYGQIGDGTTTTRYAPVRIGLDNNWRKLIASSHHTMAVKSDGSLWSWGYNPYGQLGDGTTTTRRTSTLIGTENDWAFPASSFYSSFIAKMDGTVWACGYNGDGRLGDGTTTERHSPVLTLMDLGDVIIPAQITVTSGGSAVTGQMFNQYLLNKYTFTLNETRTVAVLSAGGLDLKAVLKDSSGNVIVSNSGYTDIGECTGTDGTDTQTELGHSQINFMLRASNLSAGTYTVEVTPENGSVSTSGEFSIVLLKRPNNSQEFFEGMDALLGDGDASNDYLDIYVKALYPDYYSSVDDVVVVGGVNYGNSVYYQGVCKERQCKALANFYMYNIIGGNYLQTDLNIRNNWLTFDDANSNCVADNTHVLDTSDSGFVIFHSNDSFGSPPCTSGDYFYDLSLNEVFRGSGYQLSDFIQTGDIFVQWLSTYNHYGLLFDSQQVIDANYSLDGQLKKAGTSLRNIDIWKVVRPGN